MALGAVWLGVAAGLTAVHADLLALPHTVPAVVALTHAWVLGFFVTVATGAVYQIAPVALGTTLWSERSGWWHFGLQLVGVPGMVYAFWSWDLATIGHFGSFVLMGLLCFAVNLWRTVYRSGKRDLVAWSLVLATGWLIVAAFAGLALAANRFWRFWPTDPLALLRAHAHLGLIGFFLTLLQGVTFRLVPMFTLGHVPDWRLARVGLWLSQLGLLGLAPALSCHAGYAVAGFGALIFLGMIASGFALHQTLRTRKKRSLDPGVSAFIRGLVALVISAMLGLLLVWPTSPWSSAPGGLSAMVYAGLLLAGGLLPMIAGMMCKIVPFLTWMRAYGPRVGRGPTPAAGSLGKPRLETWAFALYTLALFPLVVGLWSLHLPLLRVGTWLIVAGAAALLVDIFAVFSHLWKPNSGAALIGSKTKIP